MPLLTVRAIEAHKPADRPYKLTLDRGLQLRIAPDNTRTLLVRYTVKGSDGERQYRLPQQLGDGAGQIRLAAACAEANRIRALAREGIDWPALELARIQAVAEKSKEEERISGLTLERAVEEYVEQKRRAKDGLALKAKTKADYLAMVQPGAVTKNGIKYLDGGLYSIAHKLLHDLMAADIHKVYRTLRQRSERQAVYAMQVLRAVLRWHGVVIAGNPLGRDTAGKDRIMLTPARGNPQPIPPEKIGAWWRAASLAPSRVASDYYRFQLLTGCRGIEIHGEKRYGYPPIRVRDLDRLGRRILLRDTKNRSDHKLLLSSQAFAIAARNAEGRGPDEALFPIVDARKTLTWINSMAKTEVQGHGLRATFASIAEELVSGGVLKKMINHATGNDVTLGHYIAKSETQLRAGWQVVADFIDRAAAHPEGGPAEEGIPEDRDRHSTSQARATSTARLPATA